MDSDRSAGDFRAGRGQGRCQSAQNIRPIVEQSLSLLEDPAPARSNVSGYHCRRAVMNAGNRSIIQSPAVRRC